LKKRFKIKNPEKDRKFLQSVQYFHVLPIANAISPFPRVIPAGENVLLSSSINFTVNV
jgi:hypothetical protein